MNVAPLFASSLAASNDAAARRMWHQQCRLHGLLERRAALGQATTPAGRQQHRRATATRRQLSPPGPRRARPERAFQDDRQRSAILPRGQDPVGANEPDVRAQLPCTFFRSLKAVLYRRKPWIGDASGNGCSFEGVGGGPSGPSLLLLLSPTGLKWRTGINKTGTGGTGPATGFYDGLRHKYVWSFRPPCTPEGSEPSGRWRAIVSGDTFDEGANWNACFGGKCEPPEQACASGRVRAWVSADTQDPQECSPNAGTHPVGPEPRGAR